MMKRTTLAVLGLLIGQSALAEDADPAQSFASEPPAYATLGEATGLLMLDYNRIDLTSGGTFDLASIHYLHQLNDWLYAGVGFGAPLVEGNYGGFFAADLALHAQVPLFGNWFADAGVAFGAGAGGASIDNILTLSGDGTLIKKYAGIGYDAGRFKFGVNIADLQIANSPIDDTMISVFAQLPLSYAVGKHAATNDSLSPADFGGLGYESIISYEYSNLTQINPTGSYAGNIGLVSPSFTQFYSESDYYFIGLDLGLSGLIWYNQAQGGIGKRISLAPRLNFYGQIGIGSGGWVTDTIDTGPGLIVYPKIKAEYMFNERLGAFASAGYFFAPLGTSKNWTIGAGLSFHLPSAGQAETADSDLALRGLRVSLFQRRMTDVVYNGVARDDLNLSSVQLDYSVDKHWYIPFQIAAATNDFSGYAGYVEGLAGLGWQTDLFGSDRVQGYAQMMIGLNDLGVDQAHEVGAQIYPSLGFNYNLSDRYSIYGQVGRTMSLGHLYDPNITNSFEGTSFGLGVSYRFSLPRWR
ncbi:MAG: hypothetical protein KDK10_16380 [Maritimibacter sp.]|nr:hypothetical protein [Maritimibacter sp.]